MFHLFSFRWNHCLLLTVESSISSFSIVACSEASRFPPPPYDVCSIGAQHRHAARAGPVHCHRCAAEDIRIAFSVCAAIQVRPHCRALHRGSPRSSGLRNMGASANNIQSLFHCQTDCQNLKHDCLTILLAFHLWPMLTDRRPRPRRFAVLSTFPSSPMCSSCWRVRSTAMPFT